MLLPLVSDIRKASRDLVREFGLMHRSVAGTDMSLSAVHAIIEVGAANGMPSKTLSTKLLLEKSTISRLVRWLVERGEFQEARSKTDARIKNIHLTKQGFKTLETIDEFANLRVLASISNMNAESRQNILTGLQDYSAALSMAGHATGNLSEAGQVVYTTGFSQTTIAQIVEMIVAYMNTHFGFGNSFETRITVDLVEFSSRIYAPANKIWRAEINGETLGTISIDGEDLGDHKAHLRWFIVHENLRGSGAGRKLLEMAINHCDTMGFNEIHLWTVKGLNAARKLYERNDFKLVEEYSGDQWGTKVTEQKFVRQLG